MALKALLLRKKIDQKTKELEALRKKGEEFETRQAQLTTAIDEVEDDEQREAVEEMVKAFDTETAEHTEAVASLEREVEGLEAELAEEERAQETTPAKEEKHEERKVNTIMKTRDFFGMTIEQRDAFFAREDVQSFLHETRQAIKEKRALTNVGLTIPEVMLGILRANIENFSKLYKHVVVRPISGDGRQIIMGAYPEAIWTECCANLNELSMTFNDLEVDCYKVSGYFAVCNATIEDSDIDLAAELLTALGQAIGYALDKAILYGRNTSAASKMPLGIVTRLVQTEAPTGYPATARAWADLHTSNVLSITAANSVGANLFKNIVKDFGAAKGKYSRGEKVWVMNEATYTTLVSEAMATNAAGAIVSGVNGVMPVVGGVIEVLDFIPDNVIIAGYFDTYILAERAGQKFATSEHVRFLADQTVLKGTARYDGAPAIAEAFVAIGINGATPAATGVSFAADTAN